MVPWSDSQTGTASPASWFFKLFTKSREINILDDLTKKGSGALRSQNLIFTLLRRSSRKSQKRYISNPLDFRLMSGVLDVDTEPPWRRRVLLVRNSSEDSVFPSPPMEFGFFLREGVTIQVHGDSLEKVPGIFVARLVPGSLAETSGLVSVDDQLLDVNGMDVAGRTIEEVTDMLTAHGMGVILTLKPATSRVYDRTLKRSRLSYSAPTLRKYIGRGESRPQTPLLVTKTAEIRYAHEELHNTEDLKLEEPPQILIPWSDPDEGRQIE